MTPLERLRAQNEEFRKDIIELAPDVWLAVGYAASNVGLIVGTDGLIVIDTTELTQAAQNILAEFRQLTDLPVRTIIYTHSHRDHISGATVFAEGGSPEIIAHVGFDSDLMGREGRPGPHAALMARTKRQFGIGLEQGTERINIGVGPGDRPMAGLGAGHLPPTRLIDQDPTRLTRSGVELELAFAPGECADNLVVWLADRQVLFSADNYYKSFPNLYAIRGTPYRDFEVWADSIDRLAAFDAEVLAPGHCRPVLGAAEVRKILTSYGEAIRSVITQTAAGMNRGLTPDQLVAEVRLPAHLADQPHLAEFYGTVAFAVRAYFAGTLGWFDGDPASLFPLPPVAEAERIAALAGGVERLADAMEAAVAAGDHQWALELAARLLRLDGSDLRARNARLKALRALADAQMNAPARNYYLVCAQEAEQV